ncbi:MAG: class 1 fructose-bisphosphatase [Sandaracinaceae bacterium]|jgi:fructose-1,6-bisphosphatase I|nr:class 1 fructose-bisphosphatase [Sandaracinaceae bacterium]
MQPTVSWGPPAPDQIGWTLERHILYRQRAFPDAKGEFTALFHQLALAGKIIGSRVTQAGLAGVLGVTGDVNVQGETVQKMDEFANATLIRCLESSGHVCIMASEENEDAIGVPEQFTTGKYVVLFDPLDGSSNIDVNISIGTIFSVHRRVSTGRDGTLKDCLQKGSVQVAAGYIMYGSSVMFVYTTGDGVHGFTLDPSIGEFLLSHEDIRIPQRGNTYSINEGNRMHWEEGIAKWVDWVRAPDAEKVHPYGHRYVGTLVADFHRTLLKGGVFVYPADKKNRTGKLRLLYEAAPMAFIAEAAGGAASSGKERILDIEPTELHQRVPLFIGSKDDVKDVERFL